jgi:cysteine-rich repeat protein
MIRVLLSLFLLAGCSRSVEVFCFSIDLEASSPVLSRLVIQTHTQAEPQPIVSTLDSVDQPLPVSFTLLPPSRFEGQLIQIEVQGFVGNTLAYHAYGSIAPAQTQLFLSAALCSNGAPESEELCDDANLIDGDGCDSTCKPSGCNSGIATPGELCFIDNDDLVGPASPLQVLTADLDGDKLPDLVAPYGADGAVRVFGNQGGFGGFETIQVPGVQRLVLGDLDGDGDQDILASVRRLNTVPGLVVLTNDGGAFSASVERPLSALSVSDLALGDINGDGVLDLVLTDSALSVVKVFLAEGQGRFGFQNQAPSVGFQPVALALADMDADGDMDAISVSASGSVSVLENQGSVLVPRLPFPVSGVPSALVLGNFTGDSLPDLAVATQDGLKGKITVFQNNAGDFEILAPFDATESLSALAAVDVDLDGDLDLVATSKTRSLIEVQFNNFGQFDPPRDASGGLFETRIGPVSLVAADLNRDGVPDLVTAGENLGLLLSNP